MTRILTNLTAFNLVALLATFVVGWVSFFKGGRDDTIHNLHIYLGLVSGTTALGVHCLIFIYFLGTGRWVKEVALAYKIPDDPLPKLTRTLKRRSFPPALFAMLIVVATSAAGAGADTKAWPWQIHATLAVLTLAINVWAFFVEYRDVSINAGIIDQVMAEVDRIRAKRGLPTNEEALRQEEESDAPAR
jgi:hypothetical protein